MKKDTLKTNGSESIRLSIECLNLVRKNKKETGMPIGRFIENLIKEKFKKDEK